MANEEFILTLYVDTGAEDDVLMLEAPFGIPHVGHRVQEGTALPATRAAPAVFYSAQNDGCVEFWVNGHSVQNEARYHVTVEYCATPAVELTCF